MALEKCVICDKEKPLLVWADYHGEAECLQCGAPYQVIQYDDKGKQITADPVLNLKPNAVEVVKLYWNEFHTRMWLGTYISYRSATHQEQHETFTEWWENYAREHPEKNL